MRPLFFFGMLPMCYLIIFSRKSKHLSEKFLSEADFFFTFRNLYHEYCAILPKKMPVFSGNKSIHPVSASASAAAVQEGIETQVRSTAAQTTAVVPSISHIGLLHALIGESGRFQLLNQMLILIVARFHLFSHIAAQWHCFRHRSGQPPQCNTTLHSAGKCRPAHGSPPEICRFG